MEREGEKDFCPIKGTLVCLFFGREKGVKNKKGNTFFVGSNGISRCESTQFPPPPPITNLPLLFPHKKFFLPSLLFTCGDSRQVKYVVAVVVVGGEHFCRAPK